MSVTQVIAVYLHTDGTYDVTVNDLARPLNERRPPETLNSLTKSEALHAMAQALDKQPLRRA